MAAINGFFGNLQGPFLANQELFTKIQEECSNQINYLSKLGIHYVGDYDLDLEGQRQGFQIFIKINNTRFQLGKTRILELEDVQITSLQYEQDMPEWCYIDYQYK